MQRYNFLLDISSIFKIFILFIKTLSVIHLYALRWHITSQRLGDRRGIHCGLDESGSGCSTLKCRTSHAPACAKPPVIGSDFIFIKSICQNHYSNCKAFFIAFILASRSNEYVLLFKLHRL